MAKPKSNVLRLVPRGIWLGASDVLGRPCPMSEPYPHIHGYVVPGKAALPDPPLVARSACAACPPPPRRERPGLILPGVPDVA